VSAQLCAEYKESRTMLAKGRSEQNTDVMKGLVAGIAGGIIASWLMNQFQARWAKLMEGKERPHGAQSLQDGSPNHGVARALEEHGNNDEDDNAAVRTGAAVAEFVFDKKLTPHQKENAGAIAHYAMGAASGAILGVAAEITPAATAGLGLPFGAAVWLVADEALVPAAGLSKGPTEYPLKVHAYALASHLVFGISTEMVRRSVRRALD
jgi:putative membrane protein